ncbi:dolichyl-phosphate-mannose--protein mannosyltransferase [Microbacterium sorbitolivorans]|uniref:Polyprenol-phosphate-mannose--protein mannosyltransferase n=1 Tax=Microbacterium sorbitolivorans TaxID=1867410 RepID=A0A367Y864_9MICO|nr:phospholipid carrier-dependent glycosyltransferase [Microbacterium sorbitolivorans]RCK62063.1 phospholipid carrier-dependent glycosyltransferase [Microbacterium sorbitolivorans]GGF43485.1 dolichyl-phosphate-mannose--protein mannosyltransferase [Microbacterium sorbitolivorans]
MIERLTSRRAWLATPQAIWVSLAVVTVAAALLRFVGLSGPHTLLFDETYYVKDAWSLIHLGYEGTWGDDPNPAFEAGDGSGYSDTGSFVAHPPLGKWIIGLGLALFGNNPFGWRVMTAVVGTALVPLVFAIAKKITTSGWLGIMAALLLAIDPLAISMSRVALLDTHLAFFILLGAWFALLDRDGTVRRIREGAEANRLAGPVVWRRPWLIAAGLALGFASGVKWSGLYALAILGLAVVAADYVDRRRAGIARPIEAAISRQGPASFVLLVFPAILTYLVSWAGWLVTSGGYDRGSSSNPFVALWNYHRSVLKFHEGVTSTHTYASPAIEWIPMLNPTLMSRESTDDGSVGLMAALPNPLLWWVGVAAVAYLVVRVALAYARRKRVHGSDLIPMIGVLGTYAPWLLLPDRTMFTFYAITILPFVILAVVIAAKRLAEPTDPVLLPDATRTEIRHERDRVEAAAGTRRVAVLVTLAAVTAVGLFFLPFGTGWMEPEALYKAHLWLPSWFL